MPLTLIEAGKVLTPQGFENAGEPLGTLLFKDPGILQKIAESPAVDINTRQAASALLESVAATVANESSPGDKVMRSRAELFHALCSEASDMRARGIRGRMPSTFKFESYSVRGLFTSKDDGLHVRVRHRGFANRPDAEVLISWDDLKLFSKPVMKTHPESERRGARLMPVNPNDLYRFADPQRDRSVDPRALQIESHEDSEATVRIRNRDVRVRFDDDDDD